VAPLFEPLEAPRTVEVPPRTLSFWRLAGPGAILVGLSIGAGEIILWPRLTAEHGASMAWGALVGVFLQLWINFEIGRWTIATGETIFTGFSRLWRGFVPIFMILTVLSWIAPGWGRAAGAAVRVLVLGKEGVVPTGFWTSDFVWTTLTFLIAVGLLLGPKIAYKAVEKSIELLVLLITVGMITVVIAVGTADHWAELGRGVINVGHLEPKVSVKDYFVLLVFAGAGGTSNLFYSFYLRDKHVGMAQHVPAIQNPLRGRTEAVPAAGFRFEDTEENRRRFRRWWEFVIKDQCLFFFALNTLTIFLFIFGALAVLHHHQPSPIVPEQGRLIWDEAVILEGVWGKAGRPIFLVVGVATLFSTQLALLDGCARSMADLIFTNFRLARRRSVNWWYVLMTGLWVIAGCAITGIFERLNVKDLGFLTNAAYMGGFAMALYVPLTLVLNHRRLPRGVRPGALCTIMGLICTVVYVGFAVACVFWEIKR
jgi:Mn2+/Fe2+ NRAMP family transporter